MQPSPFAPLALTLRFALAGIAVGTSGVAAQASPADTRTSTTAARASAATLDRITVRGLHTPLDDAAAGGTRLDLTLRETPATVIVVDGATLAARGVRTTQEALFALPGLVVASPPGHGNTVTWRGFSGAQITQLFNGIDVKYASIAARPVDAWLLGRVEAIGGPSSFLHGAGAVGGSINYVTKLANFDTDTRGGLLRAGSFGSAVIAGGINHRIGGEDATQALRIDAGHSARDGWADGEERDALVTALSFASRLGGDAVHTLALEYQDEDNDRIYWGSPAVIAPSGRLSTLPGTATHNYNVGDGYYGQQVLWARSITDATLGAHLRLRNTLYHYDALRDYRNVESYRYTAALDGVIRSGTLQQRHDQQVVGNRLDLSWDGTLAGLPTQWTTGLDASYNRQTRFPQSIGGDVDTVPIGAQTPGSFFDIPGTFAHHVPGVTNRIRTLAFSLENMTRLSDRIGLLTGLRHERIKLAVQNHRTPTAVSPARWDTDYAPTTGRIGLTLDVSDNATVYTQFSTAADPPAGILSTAGFSVLRDFDLSRGRQVELGSKLDFADGRGAATLAAFRIVRDNLAIADPDNPGQTVPVGQQSARGVEATVDFRPIDALRVQANMGWVDATLDDFVENVGGVPISRAGNRPTNTPARVGNVWLDYALSPQWSMGVDLRGVAAREVNAANTLQTAGYALWGASLRWQPNDTLTLTARGRNLADREYVLHAIGANMVYLGEPRSVELEMRVGF